MKTTVLLVLFSLVLFSCKNNNSGSTQQAVKIDSTKPTIPIFAKQTDSSKLMVRDTASKPYVSPVSQADIDAMMPPGDYINAFEVSFGGSHILLTSMKDMHWLLKQADSVKRDTNDVGPVMIYWLKCGTLSYYTGDFGDSGGLVSMDMDSINIHSKPIAVGSSDKVLKELFPKSYLYKDSATNNAGEIIVHFNDMGSFDLRFYVADGKISDIEYVINEFY